MIIGSFGQVSKFMEDVVGGRNEIYLQMHDSCNVAAVDLPNASMGSTL